MKYDARKALSNTVTYTKVSDHDIFAKYIYGFQLGKLREDSHPSFGTYKSGNSIRFRDFSTGDSGNAIEFVKRLFQLSDIKEVYDKLKEDFQNYIPSKVQINNTERKHIGIIRQDFTDIDRLYWQSFNISEDTLVRYDVFSIKHYLVNGEVKGSYFDTDPLYAYKVFDKFKIYRPLTTNKSNKWRGNLSTYDLQGYQQLPESGDLLIITKSLKDVMVLYELGYNAVAPPSETSPIPKVVMDHLQSRFKKIVILYDRDHTGINYTRHLIRNYGCDFAFVDRVYHCKDISDLVKNHSMATARQFLNKRIKK